MNIYDISKKTGVSIATVSRVINGSSNVSEKTRSKVLAAIDEMGYTPNVFARGLGLNTMKTIGIMCADSSDPYLARAIYHIEQELRKNNYDSLLSCTGYDHDVKEKCMTMLLSKRVDAVVLVGSNYIENDDQQNNYIKNAAATVPVMIVNGVLNAPNVYCTTCDDSAAIYEVTENFIKSGKRNLLYIFNSHSYSGTKKLDGFRSAVKDAGIRLPDDGVHFIDSHNVTVQIAKNAVAEIAKKGIKFDGIITSDDIIAVGVLKYAREAGISVPEDLFVTGYNNFDISECCEPELTSVDNKLETLCRNCVSNLMDILSDDRSLPKKTVFSAEIIERSTTKFTK
ncbi:MAG: LacI family DNA-binding transcriptional regulator [Oscillospiraceae bacterium]